MIVGSKNQELQKITIALLFLTLIEHEWNY